MIGKLPVLGFSLVTAMSSQALAHEPHDSWQHRRHEGYAPAVAQVDLRYADLNRDGVVTMEEALDSGRQMFRRQDRDHNRVLTRHEAGGPRFHRDDRNDDGRVSMREYQRAVRAQFANLDRNRDGYLVRYELGGGSGYGPRGSRSAGWWR